jgi:hypothetical protein
MALRVATCSALRSVSKGQIAAKAAGALESGALLNTRRSAVSQLSYINESRRSFHGSNISLAKKRDYYEVRPFCFFVLSRTIINF